MKKYLLPSALILVFGLGLALAQSITKSVQVRPDPSGTIGYDTNNNIYFPAHVLSTGPGLPTASSPAGTAPAMAAGSTDFVGQFQGATGNNTASIIFNKAYAGVPTCLAISQNPATSPIAYNAVATGINFTTANNGSVIINYICSGPK